MSSHTQPQLAHPTHTRAHTHEVHAHRDANMRCTLAHSHSHMQAQAWQHTLRHINACTESHPGKCTHNHTYLHRGPGTLIIMQGQVQTQRQYGVHMCCSHSTQTPMRRLFLMRSPKSPGRSRHVRCLVLTLPRGWAVPPTAWLGCSL